MYSKALFKVHFMYSKEANFFLLYFLSLYSLYIYIDYIYNYYNNIYYICARARKFRFVPVRLRHRLYKPVLSLFSLLPVLDRKG